jgi:uncharacterized RDD family membrane protein YckC
MRKIFVFTGFEALFLVNILFGSVVAQEAIPGVNTLSSTALGDDKNDLVKLFGGDAIVEEGQFLETVVVIGGNAIVRGEVESDIVVIGGDLLLYGSAGGNVVVIGGKATIGSSAFVKGDLVMIGAESSLDSKATVNGNKVIIVPWMSGSLKKLKEYSVQCLFKGRFIAPSLPWTMGVLGAVIFLMLILSLIFPAPFNKSVDIVEHRILLALVTGILIPVAMGPVLIALSVSVIGIPAIPALFMVLQGAMLIGVFALCAHTGKQVIRIFSCSFEISPIVAALIGVILFSAVMIIPFVGGFFTVVISTLGTGAGVFAIINIVRTSRSGKQAILPNDMEMQNNSVASAEPVQEAVNPQVMQTQEIAPVDRVRATFFQRAGAAVIDIILVMMLYGMTFKPFFEHVSISFDHHGGGPVNLFLLLTYLTIMWNWKQTTIGMIVFRLKIFRTDNSKFTLGVAVIRALGLLLSIVPLGLGFLWIAWDEQKQGWHDKIAGTMVCRVSEKISIV